MSKSVDRSSRDDGFTLIEIVVALAIFLVAGPMSYPAYVVLLICVYLVSVYGVNVTIGFSGVLSGPLVRSSYRAGRLYRQAMDARAGVATA